MVVRGPIAPRSTGDGAARSSRCHLEREFGYFGEKSLFLGEAKADFRVLIERANGVFVLAKARGREVVVKTFDASTGGPMRESRGTLTEDASRRLASVVTALNLLGSPGLRE